jgi:hypothetical protein
MPYIPRAATTANCTHCGTPFESRNLRRKYCSSSCNVLASYARTGQRAKRPTKADLEKTVAEMKELVNELRAGQLKEKMLNLKDELAAVETPAAGKYDHIRQILGIDPPVASKPVRKRTRRP